MSGAWKQRERLVASWFGNVRNPLSGRNNVNDDGSKRLGDICYRYAVVEIKRRKTFSLKYAKETKKLAVKYGLPWICIEFKTGEPDIVRFSVSRKEAKYVCKALKLLWEDKCPGKK